MQKTRASLYYLASYLVLGGLGLFVAPELALKLLFANGDYGTVMPRLAGMLMLGLGVFVTQMIRHDLTVLYPTTLVVRAFFIVSLLALYFATADPLFIALTIIVGIGFVLTGYTYLSEKT